MRIASLLPSASEIIAALGAGDAIVARSHECDFPAGLRDRPVVTRAKLDLTRPSGVIDREVKALLAATLSIYELDVARLQALAPDVIVTQTQCEVCAVPLTEVERALAGWHTRLVALAPNRLEDVFADIARIGAAIDRAAEADALIAHMRDRLSHVASLTKGAPRPRIAGIEWLDPPMAGGNWLPELITLAGGDALFGVAGAHSPWLAFDDLVAADPDVIAILPCGFTIARTRAELPVLTARRGWATLRAVREGRVTLLDGNALFNRPGPRLVESAEVLAEILHPTRCHFGHHGRYWVAAGDPVT